MSRVTRRRFLTIAGAAILVGDRTQAAPLRQWRGTALGAGVRIVLAHPDGERIAARAMAEIARLERIFSLYRAESALNRLNGAGELTAPPFELLECLSLCSRVHAATRGLFDPTVQPLWALYAESYANGAAPARRAVDQTLARVGWSSVTFDAQRIRFARSGMALTLNGVAQGYIADRVAALLRSEGLINTLIDTGELNAIGRAPDGGGWPVSLNAGGHILRNAVRLRDRALASSAPLGTVLDAAARAGHIIDPRDGTSAPLHWTLVSVTAPDAALADALSTAMVIMDRDGIEATLAKFTEVQLVHLS